jgi:phospholipase A1/A2
MNIFRWLLLSFALASVGVRAEIIISMPRSEVVAGKALSLDLTILNPQAEALVVEVPSPVHVRLETAEAVTTLEFVPERSGIVQVPPREFVKMSMKSLVPVQAQGVAKLSATGLQANSLTVQIAAGATTSVAQTEGAPAEQEQTALVDKPPPLAVSVYEPVYVLMGGDGGWNAKFQISFRYRLFDDRGPLAQRLPWIDDLYLSFSQTSLWDLNDLSKPFRDSSYRPRLFYANYDLARFLDGQLRFGVESGAGHESNGKDGADSRSFNMFYARPTFTVGDPDGLRFYAAPLIHNYIADEENPDLKDYRGYIDWLIGFGSKGGLDFWATLRKGTRSDFGSVELNASYPLSKLSGGDLTGWLMLQYFGGYGESLLDYRTKLDAQLRLGISIAL